MSASLTSNIHWHSAAVTKKDRHRLNDHKSCVIWLTGLSGSGKSTIANALDKRLYEMSIRSYVLDGDNIRHGLNKSLGFSPEDRKENIRRIAEVAKLFVDAGTISITAFISPYREDRLLARNLLEEGEFIEIYVKCPIEQCEQRDPKGLYKKARRGEIPDFTGISSPYEEPDSPELVIESNQLTVDECVDQIVDFLKNRGIV
ncbi:adenylyl-sulfate kinase [Effusibacillus dendaii]|nr:adenylyl-sulfate kinase [Effusibacillus dendaii]